MNDITVTMNMRSVSGTDDEEYTPAKFSSIDELIVWLEKHKDTLIAFTIHGGRR